MTDLKAWLPINKKELQIRGWDQVDVIIISGDAYVDHPSFGHALIARLIENQGFRVAVLPQPNWRDDLRDFKKLGKPRLFFGITSGAMDSMINHYTAFKRLRSDDAYTAGNVAGFRPDYATTVYSQIVKKLFPDSLVILGGIEASLRRFTHYDYWSDSLKPSVLKDSKADLLVYGMGEKSILDILNVFKQKNNPQISDFKDIQQIAYLSDKTEEGIILHSHENCLESKQKFAENFKIIETESNKTETKKIIQSIENQYLIVNPPSSMTTVELDTVYELPFTRLPHPTYIKRGEIPAFTMINCSVNIHRGCFGGCSFCTISAHQGKFIVSRSENSIIKEVQTISKMPYFKGYISDLGGPSANMYRMQGIDFEICKKCNRPSCIFPTLCYNLCFDHYPLLTLYRKISKLPKIKKITIGSGVRYDMLQTANAEKYKSYGLQEYTTELIRNHVSGRLKVAPEHTENHILHLIRKPSFDSFITFKKEFDTINLKFNLNQQLIPYFISSLPSCRLQDMQTLSRKMKHIHYKPEQVQDFTPTPMTLASVIFYTGINPYTGEKVFCETNINKKREQNSFFFKTK